MKEIRIGKNQCGQRLDKFLQKYLTEAPKSFLYKMLRKKNIKRNGKRAEGSEILREGDVLTFFLSDETLEKFTGNGADTVRSRRAEGAVIPRREAVILDILFENEHIALINKPPGMLSQKAAAGDVSLVEYFLEYTGGGEMGFRPGICNRLDRNTSGIVIGGKNSVRTAVYVGTSPRAEDRKILSGGSAWSYGAEGCPAGMAKKR